MHMKTIVCHFTPRLDLPLVVGVVHACHDHIRCSSAHATAQEIDASYVAGSLEMAMAARTPLGANFV